jgi:hypothetical protein
MNEEIGTITGRITNLEPEMQELYPRKRLTSEIEILNLDLSNLELRIMAWLNLKSKEREREMMNYFTEFYEV